MRTGFRWYWILAMLSLMASVAAAATPFQTFHPRAVDLEASGVITQQDQPATRSDDALLAVMGLNDARPRWSVKPEGDRPAIFRVAFEQPVDLGAVVIAGSTGTVKALRPDAPYPGDPFDESQWQTLDSRKKQRGSHIATAQPGTQTRALLLIDPSPGWRGASLNKLRLLSDSLTTGTPHASAYASSHYTRRASHGPPTEMAPNALTGGGPGIGGRWENAGENSSGVITATPISDVAPAWFILAWDQPRTLRGLLIESNAEDLHIERFEGPEGVHPRAGTSSEWKRIRDFESTDDGGWRWLWFDQPVTTRGLRLVIEGVSSGSEAVTYIESLQTFETPSPDHVASRDDTPDPMPVRVAYTLDEPALVTIVVNDENGRRVRNLLGRQPQEPGEHEIGWNLRDEAGNYVKPGKYTAKAIHGPELELRYLATPYPNVTQHAPQNAPWQTSNGGPDGWMADHTAPLGATVAGDHVWLGSAVAESGVSLIEVDTDGAKQWAYDGFASFTGSRWLASDGQTVFSAAPAHNFGADKGIDRRSEFIWAIDTETKKVSDFAALEPTAERQRGMQAMTAGDGKLFVAVQRKPDYLTNAALASDVDVENTLPRYARPRKARTLHEIVPDPRNDFLRLFRLHGTPPGGNSQEQMAYLESTRGSGNAQHIVLPFNKPIALGSLLLPIPGGKDYIVSLSYAKPNAPYPPNPGNPGHWQKFEQQAKPGWQCVPAPENVKTRALRISFIKGGKDDIFSSSSAAEFDADAAFDASMSLDAPADGDALSFTDGEPWQARLEGARLLRRRFENLSPEATVRVTSGEGSPGGAWTARRDKPISEDNPAIYMLEWDNPRDVHALAIRDIDAQTTLIEVWEGNGSPRMTATEGWRTVESYTPPRRDHRHGFESRNAKARYIEGLIDFGQSINTRAVRLRIVEPWTDNGPGYLGQRKDRGGETIDPTRARIDGVAALAYLGGEVPVDPKTFERIEVLDIQSGEIVHELPAPKVGSVAWAGEPSDGRLLAIFDKTIVAIDRETGEATPLADDLLKPRALTADRQGRFYAFDADPSRRNVRVYDREGNLLREVGKTGGFENGLWDPQRMGAVTSLAVDSKNQLWVVENQHLPKRITVWSPEGQFIREHLGNTEYGGGGVVDIYDPTKLRYKTLEFEIDYDTGKTRLRALTGGGEVPVRIDGRDYLTTRDTLRGTRVGEVYRYDREEGVATLIAAVGEADNFDPIKEPTVYDALGAPVLKDHIFTWSDVNDDAQVQVAEVTIMPRPSGMYRMTPFKRDLSVMGGTVEFLVDRYTSSGVPIYKARELPIRSGINIRVGPNEVFHQGRGEPQMVLTNDGQVQWTWASEGASVHALTRAKPWWPGQLVCEFPFSGHGTVHEGDFGGFVMAHTNVGKFNLWTTDGMLAARIFRDLREPGVRSWRFKEHEPGTSLNKVTPGQEHFAGWFGRTEDNRYLAVAGHNHASVVEVIGLTDYRRFEQPLPIEWSDIQATRDWALRQEKKQVFERAPVLQIPRMTRAPRIDGEFDDDWSAQASIVEGDEDGRPDRTAKFYIGYDKTRLYLGYEVRGFGPLLNTGQQWDRLFKTGAAVDLQIGVNPEANPGRSAAEQGDKRLLITVIDDQPTLVLYDAVVPGTSPEQAVEFVSPVASISFDRVVKIEDAEVRWQRGSREYGVEVAVPLETLDLALEPGMRLKIDWGLLTTDDAGNSVLRRVYWANQATAMTADVPSEATLHPDLWGNALVVEPSESGPPQPTAQPAGESIESNEELDDFFNELE